MTKKKQKKKKALLSEDDVTKDDVSRRLEIGKSILWCKNRRNLENANHEEDLNYRWKRKRKIDTCV